MSMSRHRPLTDSREARDECGVAAVVGHPQAASAVQWALLALQHRGQESAGIASADEQGRVFLHRGMGLVSDVLRAEQLQRLPGPMAVGHVRYSTTGASRLENAQPILSRFRGRFLAIAHNGNLVNASHLRQRLEEGGAIFQTTTDTEVVAHLVARHGGPTEAALVHALGQIAGAWALVVLDPQGVLVARDPLGIRPLSLGRLQTPTGREAWVAASETCALDALGAAWVRDVEPGEVARLDGDGIRTVARLAPAGVPGGTTVARGGLCAFEAIYLARPDSVLFGQSVHGLRKEMGRELAREHPAPGDLVTGVPDSSLSAAMGYAEELGLPYEMGLVRNRYVGRTFIQPAAGQRRLSVNAKLNAVRKVVQGRRVVLVDDSIVRGTTARRIVQLLRDAGAREVHVRIASPPYRFPCHYGVDTARREELIAFGNPVESIRAAIGADSLAFLSLARMRRVLGGPACEACFTGRYPVPVDGAVPKMALEPVAVEEGDAG
ncbi:amidophosphoribosyltransferase [Geochorda subterranea]|uniref:Amidophosphoribosyltransferase n=1 Tax=Geochorda subterranea TaxID=3109564 RepID=A0ABZ1BR31_9FIRM|nr:amidophosphoribosyltransferase [Limnochorda sp. LNt]WRP14911.1 amidophosphoribosyltransferase [Limnochorda sp. LNt]